MSLEEKSTEINNSLSKVTKEPEQNRTRSPSLEPEEEEELDEFGRVKRRRQKFKNERSEDEADERYDSDRGRREDDYYSHRRHRQRSSSRSRSRSRSRSPRRSYRRRYSDSESDYEHYRSSSRHRHHRSSRYSRHHHSNSRGGDVYSEAAQYIDTEFYPTKVYVGDLENVTEKQLEYAFSRFGALEDVRLVEGKDYGFVTFEKKDAALAAIRSLHGTLLGSKRIKVNRAKIPERNKVGFGNVPWQDEDGLLAKEALYENNHSRRPSLPDYSTSTSLPLDPRAASIPNRVLTSYDDL
ncbi:uncharacterized protein B0P05DRAFT_535537 [Gilbertella persicaria]|uniref:uncharacterized protein n=1 Tax=Gilbertella persicaria TaxID=101096 RepID=UPI00221F41EC|nr:uncharacterized protein B0P05DRAFT_535537 [Gilbertella persicaria]KAI8084427.1 hypothetical protein B0P05DRAFT_535537 [Gilbertella persicaria]